MNVFGQHRLSPRVLLIQFVGMPCSLYVVCAISYDLIELSLELISVLCIV